MTRKAYAKSADGHTGLMFGSARLRDFFLGHVSGYERATCGEWRHIKAMDRDHRDEWGNVVAFSRYSALNMGVAEYWDGDWQELYEKACNEGLL